MSQPPNLYTQLTFHTSDGVDTVYPEKTEKLVEPDGSYEYFRPIAHNENRSIWWRNKTANGLMEAYKLNKPNVEYIFTSFPENYKLFEHVKFRGGKLRTDTYLFGHPASKRFRSVNEFIPHLRYLAGKDKVCTCTYCERGSHRAGTTVRRGTKKSDAIEARKTINIEERQKEQETAGWVLRKGEIVWVWVPDNREAEQDEGDPLIDYDGGIWMAGIVADRPNYTPPLEKDRSLFSGIETDDNLSPWQEIGDECYTIQLCSDSAPGEIMTNVRQHHVKPWLARPGCVEVSDHIEHPTIPIARKMAETFCLFERQSNDMAFKGAFVGAEKIFLHDPIRITHDSHEFEDVMVVEKIYIDKKKDESGKERSVFMFHGAQYTAYPSEGCTPLTVEEFLSLPFRMKRGSGFNQIIRWYRRTRPNQRAEISLATVLGRWYEPQAVYAWTGSTGFSGGNRTGDMALCGATVRRIVKNRKEGLGLHSLNGVDLETDVEVKIRPGLLKLDDAEDTPARDQVTPERGFKSVNLRIPSTTPGVSPQKEMELKRELNEEGSEEMVEEVEEVEEVEVELEPEVEMLEASAEDDEDYDEDEEEIDEFVAGRFDKYRRPGPEVLSQSPTKRPRR